MQDLYRKIIPFSSRQETVEGGQKFIENARHLLQDYLTFSSGQEVEEDGKMFIENARPLLQDDPNLQQQEAIKGGQKHIENPKLLL